MTTVIRVNMISQEGDYHEIDNEKKKKLGPNKNCYNHPKNFKMTSCILCNVQGR